MHILEQEIKVIDLVFKLSCHYYINNTYSFFGKFNMNIFNDIIKFLLFFSYLYSDRFQISAEEKFMKTPVLNIK